MTNSKIEDIKARLMENGQFSVLVFSILLKKAIEFLVENAEITVGEKKEEAADAE